MYLFSIFKIPEEVIVEATSPYGASPPVAFAELTQTNFDFMMLNKHEYFTYCGYPTHHAPSIIQRNSLLGQSLKKKTRPNLPIPTTTLEPTDPATKTPVQTGRSGPNFLNFVLPYFHLLFTASSVSSAMNLTPRLLNWQPSLSRQE